MLVRPSLPISKNKKIKKEKKKENKLRGTHT